MSRYEGFIAEGEGADIATNVAAAKAPAGAAAKGKGKKK